MRYIASPDTKVSGVFRGEVVGPLIFDEDGILDIRDDTPGAHEVLATAVGVSVAAEPKPKPKVKE